MSFTDYLLNGVLVAMVVLQIRGRRLTVRMLALPVVIVVFVAVEYLHGIPTSGGDPGLIAVGAAAGLVLGVGAGLATRVYRRGDGAVMAKAGVLAAVLWVLGVGARLAFELVATNGGARAIGRFSVAHHLNAQAWVAALILMALLEVFGRTAALGTKYVRVGAVAEAEPGMMRVRDGRS